MYVYFGMYGLKSSTKGWEQNFKFTSNEWNLTYSDIDVDVKEKIESTSIQQIANEMFKSKEEFKVLFYDLKKVRLYESKTVHKLGYKTYDDLLKMLDNVEEASYYFSENDVYMNLRLVQKIINDKSTSINFTQKIKKIYNLNGLNNIYNNQPYVKVRFINNKMRIIS